MIRISLCSVFFLFVTFLFGQNEFITKWETTARNEIVELSLTTSDNSYSINWGDGTTTTETSGNPSHSYRNSGTHSIVIEANIQKVNFAGKTNLLEVSQWGSSNWTSFEFSFRNCTKLKITASDTPNLSQVLSMIGTFSGASSFNQDINDWNVSNVTNMALLFSGATSFDQNLEDWDVSNVANMNSMFNNVELSVEHYDALLEGWSKLNLKKGVVFDAGESHYCAGEDARQKIIDTYSWIIRDNRKNCEILNVNDNLDQRIQIFPNPVSSQLNIQGISDIQKISIYGITGELINTTTSDLINMSDVSPGIYLVLIETTAGSIWKEVSKY